VSYRIQFEGQALIQIKGLPQAALMRLLSFQVDEATELSGIFDIAWIG
jgi:hypothetical protein